MVTPQPRRGRGRPGQAGFVQCGARGASRSSPRLTLPSFSTEEEDDDKNGEDNNDDGNDDDEDTEVMRKVMRKKKRLISLIKAMFKGEGKWCKVESNLGIQ